MSDDQLTQIEFVKWLIQPTTNASNSNVAKNRQSEMAGDKSDTSGDQEASVATTMTPPSQHITTAASDATTEKPIKQISCIQCQQRKIKCDRAKPSCGHCIKSKLGPCEYRPPAPPRRGKRKPVDTDLLSRLRKCEELLRESGIAIDEDGNVNSIDSDASIASQNTPIETPARKHRKLDESETDSHATLLNGQSKLTNGANFHTGSIVLEEGGSRYLESDLWRGLDAEASRGDNQSLDVTGNPSEDDPAADISGLNNGEFLFDTCNSRTPLASLHPSLADIHILWTVFLENVDPLLKVLHVPTFEPQLWQAVQDINTIPSTLEPLVFAIYAIAVASMPAVDCEKTFGIAKSVLFAKYQSAVKKAFVNASILVSTDFKLVQAIVIWLHAIRDTYHPHALWILSGVALRMAQRAGLHREKALANFSPFDAEIRRRTWWALMTVDARAAELSGSGASVFHNAHDTEIPRNLNDSDLSPGMRELPPDRTGPTEMIFVSLRLEVAKFYKNHLPFGKDGQSPISYPDLTDEKIDAFEQTLEHKFLRFCDALYPLHYITSIVGRACAGGMRLITHHPCRDPIGKKNISEAEKVFLYQQSVKLIKYHHLLISTPALATRYRWHCNAYFPWHAFIFVITTLCKRSDQRRAAESWALVQKTFEFYPEMVTNTQIPLHVALGNLVMKAWDATGDWFSTGRTLQTPVMSPAASTPGTGDNSVAPEFVVKLRKQRQPRETLNHRMQAAPARIPSTLPRQPQPATPGMLAQSPERYSSVYRKPSHSQIHLDINTPENPFLDMVDMSPEAWLEWDRLLAGSQNMEFPLAYPDANNWYMQGPQG